MSFAWKTRGCTTAAELDRTHSANRPVQPPCATALCNRPIRPPGSTGLGSPGFVLGAQIDAQGQDAVDELGLRVADHGVVGEVTLGLLSEALTLGPFNWWDAPGAHGLGPGAEAGHHFVWIEHQAQRRGPPGSGAPLDAGAPFRWEPTCPSSDGSTLVGRPGRLCWARKRGGAPRAFRTAVRSSREKRTPPAL